MRFLKRFGYYLIGLSLGSLLVLFIWKGKDVAFPYGPDARTLSSIRKKQIEYTDPASVDMVEKNIDSVAIWSILTIGSVDFGKSQPRLKPCAEYHITGTYQERNIGLYIQRCDSVATIQKVWLESLD